MTQKKLTDFGRTQAQKAVTDGGETPDSEDEEDEQFPHADLEEESVTDAWIGAYIYTQNHARATTTTFAQIVGTSETGKNVYCRLVHAERVAVESVASEKVRPTAEKYGPEFRLKVRDVNGLVFRGSYPIDKDDTEEMSSGQFYPFENDEGRSIHQTPTGYV